MSRSRIYKSNYRGLTSRKMAVESQTKEVVLDTATEIPQVSPISTSTSPPPAPALSLSAEKRTHSRPPILITDAPLAPGYFLVAREGYDLRVIQVRSDGSQQSIDEVFYEKRKNLWKKKQSKS